MRFELHCHSTCSDGTQSPDQVAALAAERAIAVFALTDHDTCNGSHVVVPGAHTVRGVEISCDYKGRTIHVLAYDRGTAPDAWAALETMLATIRAGRINRLRVMAAKLEHRGVKIDIEPLIAASVDRSVGRPDLARAMVAAGYVSSMKDAFHRHLHDGGPVDVPTTSLTIADALAAAREANAATSLAHPHTYDEMSVAIVRDYAGKGLTGIEALYAGYQPAERDRWLSLAKRHNLVCTAGSDWHGPDDAHAQLGVDVNEDRASALRDWLGI